MEEDGGGSDWSRRIQGIYFLRWLTLIRLGVPGCLLKEQPPVFSSLINNPTFENQEERRGECVKFNCGYLRS
jgi:hypothetical protein